VDSVPITLHSAPPLIGWVYVGLANRTDLTAVGDVVIDVVFVRERDRVRMPTNTSPPNISLEPSGLGISMVLPEWTASAAGWTLATVVEAACVMAPETENFACESLELSSRLGTVALLTVSDGANRE